MGVFLVGSVLVTTTLVPEGKSTNLYGAQPASIAPEASNRALAYLAHGGILKGARNEVLNPLFGPWFGTLYDVVTILVLCLAGLSFSIGVRDLMPRYLAHYGMQLDWARKIGVITHLSNLTIILVTVVFRASVENQQWAYATSVMVLLTAASLAAVLDVRLRWQGSWLRYLVSAPFLLIGLFFVLMTVLLLYHSLSGLAIALILVALVVGTAIVFALAAEHGAALRGLRLRCQRRSVPAALGAGPPIAVPGAGAAPARARDAAREGASGAPQASPRKGCADHLRRGGPGRPERLLSAAADGGVPGRRAGGDPGIAVHVGGPRAGGAVPGVSGDWPAAGDLFRLVRRSAAGGQPQFPAPGPGQRAVDGTRPDPQGRAHPRTPAKSGDRLRTKRPVKSRHRPDAGTLRGQGGGLDACPGVSRASLCARRRSFVVDERQQPAGGLGGRLAPRHGAVA